MTTNPANALRLFSFFASQRELISTVGMTVKRSWQAYLGMAALCGMLSAQTQVSANPMEPHASMTSQEIPAEYLGQWTNRQEHCGREGWDEDSSLFVSETRVGFYDNGYQVKSARRSGNRLKISYFPRAGGDIEPVRELRLSPDGETVFTSAHDKIGLRRCPNEGRPEN